MRMRTRAPATLAIVAAPRSSKVVELRVTPEYKPCRGYDQLELCTQAWMLS